MIWVSSWFHVILLHDITSSRVFSVEVLWYFGFYKNIQKSFFPIRISNGIREDIGLNGQIGLLPTCYSCTAKDNMDYGVYFSGNSIQQIRLIYPDSNQSLGQRWLLRCAIIGRQQHHWPNIMLLIGPTSCPITWLNVVPTSSVQSGILNANMLPTI